MPLPVEFVAVYVVRECDGRHEALQLKRSIGRYLGGQWSFAGGHVEAGESPQRAAVRELQEETGVAASDMRVMTHLSSVETVFSPTFGGVVLRAGFCCVVGADTVVKLNDEHTDTRWIGRSDFARCVLWPGERAALAEIWREHLRPSPALHLRQLDPADPDRAQC